MQEYVGKGRRTARRMSRGPKRVRTLAKGLYMAAQSAPEDSAGRSTSGVPRLSAGQARNLQLHALGLLQPRKRRATRGDLVAAIGQMRMLQIDTIHVVARSPYLVLHARLGAYPPQWLDEALAAGQLAECWAHEASFVTAGDFPLHDAWRSQRTHHWSHRGAARMHRDHRDEMDALLARIASDGPVRAADFAREDRGVSGWWEWKPEKRWLEAWFTLGNVMVLRRERFQRVYELADRVRARLDPALDKSSLDIAGLRQRFILDSVRALGVTSARWIADYYRLKPSISDVELAPLVAQGLLHPVAVTGWKLPGYVHADHAAALAQAVGGRLRATHTALLSPFDPLVWDRQRLQVMFGFDYSLECYTPAPRRRYGYFVLPILHRGALIGRLDAKAHRGEAVFEIKSLHLETDIDPSPRLCAELALAIRRTALWHDTPTVRLGRCRPSSFGPLLRAALTAHV